MSDEAKCSQCGTSVSYETGFTMTGGLGDNSLDRVYCPACAPKTGKGYTLSDMQEWQQREREERAAYQLRRQAELMDMLGPDVFFAAGFANPKRDRKPFKQALRTMKAIDATMDELLNGGPS